MGPTFPGLWAPHWPIPPLVQAPNLWHSYTSEAMSLWGLGKQILNPHRHMAPIGPECWAHVASWFGIVFEEAMCLWGFMIGFSKSQWAHGPS